MTPFSNYLKVLTKFVSKSGAEVFKVLKNGVIVESQVSGKYAGWRPGKIFGRLDCKSGMKMKKENRVFFLTWEDAIAEGYRPCKKCKPTPKDAYPKR